MELRCRASQLWPLALLIMVAMSEAYRTPVGVSMSSSTDKGTRRRHRHPGNAEGNLYVDTACIDCDVCRWLAPSVYSRSEGQSVVTKQPISEAERREAYRAMVSCPVGSIKTIMGDPLVKAVREDFPLEIDAQALPGVYHMGFHAASTYGAAAYFVRGSRRHNVMFDVPRYSPHLADRLEAMGGLHTLVMSHRDDVGEHDKWKARFPGLLRVLHELEVEAHTVDVEVRLEGQGPTWALPGFPDGLLLFTPGHTRGHVCLLLTRGKGALLSGDHLAKAAVGDCLSGHPNYNWYDKRVQGASIRALADLPFTYLLPGHGRRYIFTQEQEERRQLFEDAAQRLEASQ